MLEPTKINLKVYQGSTFSQVLRWESAAKVYSPITNINKTAPMVVQAPGHGVPAGWRVKIKGAQGMKEVNTDQYLTATSVDTNSIVFNEVNAIAYSTYTGGAVLEYYQPVDLTGYTARMHIRSKIEDVAIIKELTTENGLIAINNTNKTIVLNIPAQDTAQFSFKQAVYSLELIKGTTVTTLIVGNVALVKEATR